MRYQVLISICFMTASVASAGSWAVDNYLPGVNGRVNTMVVHNDSLHIGGAFTAVGHVTATNLAVSSQSALWDGSMPSQFGEILKIVQGPQYMYALARHAPDGHPSLTRVLRRNQYGWEQIWPSVPTDETTLCIYQNHVHVGPYRLVDDEWINILNADNQVTQLAVQADNLILAGSFLNAGGQPMSHIATWNNGVLSPMGSGLHTTPVDLIADDTALYVLMDSGWATSFDLMIWSEGSWSTETHPNEAWTWMSCLTFYRGDVAVIGHYGNYICGPVPVAMTIWNGATWTENAWLGFGSIHDAVVWQDELVFCGGFRGQDGIDSVNLIAYGDTGWHSLFDPGYGIWWDNPRVVPYLDSVISFRPAESQGPFDPLTEIVQPLDHKWQTLTTTSYAHVMDILSDGVRIALVFEGSTVGIWQYGDNWVYMQPSAQTPTVFHNGTLYSPGNIVLKSEADQWEPMMTSVTGNITTLGVWNDKIVASGEFTGINSDPVRRLAINNGISWQEIGGGLNGPANVMCEWNGNLVVAGDFTEAGGVAVPGLAAWTGSEWITLGNYGVEGTIFTMESYESRLFIGGDFSKIDTVPAINFARLGGAYWISMAVDFNGTVSDLHAVGSKLYISGNFTHVVTHGVWSPSNPHMHQFAVRSLISVANDPQNPDPTDLPLTQTTIPPNTPNPFNPSTEIRFDLAHPGPVQLTVHDTRGRLVRTLLNEPRGTGSTTITWDGCDDQQRALPSGVYIVKLQTAEESASRKVTLAR